MSGFSMQTSGDWKKWTEALQKAGNINYEKVHKKMGEALVSNAHLRFVDEKSPSGEVWKKGYKKSGQTLSNTARLSSSITYKASKKHVEVGTNVIYAAIHQFGGKIKAKKKNFLKFNINGKWSQKKVVVIPKREFIGISGDDKEDIINIFKNTLKGTLK